MSTNSYTKNYSLSLRDGNNWCITCDEHSIQILNKLSIIMNLKECKLNSSPILIFSKMEEYEKPDDKAMLSQQSLPSYDVKWKCYDFGSQDIRIWYHSQTSDIVCEVNGKDYDNIEYISMLYSIRQIYNRSVIFGGLPFHAGLAEFDGRGVLFSASGGTGKSTCCRRLPDYWKPLCDDETLVVLDDKREYRAHPFPTWSDYLMNRARNTWDVQCSIPVSAIFFLEQADNDEVIPLTISRASVLITESAFQEYLYNRIFLIKNPKELIELRKKLFNNAFSMAMAIPAFRLRVSLHGKFWEEVEKVMDL